MAETGRTLAVDIGGTGLKMILLDAGSRPVSERLRVLTPRPAVPGAVLGALVQLADGLDGYDRVSVGFPGVVVDGITLNAPNLHPSWAGVALTARLGERLGRPVRAANDADLAALGVVQGVGVELCITLGTGVGSGLCVDGRLVPNVEIGHAPWRTGQSYEDLLGDAGRREIGNKAWSRLLMSAVTEWRRLFNPCALYLGGGNAKKIKVELPNGVQRVDNTAGLVGGVALWRHRRE